MCKHAHTLTSYGHAVLIFLHYKPHALHGNLENAQNKKLTAQQFTRTLKGAIQYSSIQVQLLLGSWDLGEGRCGELNY